MEKNVLMNWINEGLSSYEISAQSGKSPSTVKYWLKKHLLITKKIYKCRKCKSSDPTHFSSGRFTECKKCRSKDQNRLYQRYKRELVDYKGGKCEICGYKKCIAALDFHHINPDEKDPNWKQMRKWVSEKVKKEVDKCQLVCRNCHSEIHYGKT